ncbi:MAG: hypothetical protein ABIR71_11430 [Chthoniobacterales bacterium]
MKILRTAFAVLVLSMLAVSPMHAGEKHKSATGTTEGTFAGIEEGDYPHFLIKDKKGASDSFIVLHRDKSVEAFLHNPAKLKGRKVRVFWTEEMIPQAGQKQKTVTKVEEREPLDH